MTFLASLLKHIRESVGRICRLVESMGMSRFVRWESLYITLIFGMVTLGGFASCTGGGDGPSRLKIDLTSLKGGDSLLYVLRIGERMQWRDTLDIVGEKSIELILDTNKVFSVLLSSDSGRWMKYYKYDLGKWEEQMPDVILPLDSASVRELYGRDSHGAYQSLSGIYNHHLTVVAFSNISLRTISKMEQDTLKRRLGRDNLRFAYFMLTLSDSTALGRLKRDSLEGFIFSDTLGFVSEARRHFGVSRDTAVRLFTIDSLGVIRSLK